MKLSILALLTVFLVATPFVAESQESNDKIQSANIDQLFKSAFDRGLFNGAVLVSQNGKAIYKNAFGIAEATSDRKLNVTSDFYLASVSKQFTAMCIMLLKEQGKLDYDDTLDDYFPEFPDYAKSVTVKHMLTHTSGIANHYNLGIYKPGLTNQEVYETLIKQENLNFNPGEKYEYSNGGYVMLALITEKVSGMPMHKFMDLYIFKPLDMSRSLVYHAATPNIENRAVGYTDTGELDDYVILTTGAGGLFSSVEDLYKWDQALYSEKLVSKATLEEAFTPTILNNGEVSNYGYGWSITENDHKKSVSHSGSLSGYRTYIRRNLYDKSGYIILTNDGGRSDIGALGYALDNILTGQSFELPKRPIAKVVQKELDADSSKNLISVVKELMETYPDEYAIDEMRINRLGYSYLRLNDIDKALKIFELNTKLNPESSNVYDSLGEALLIKGDSASAIANYQRSYTLNRNNSNAIEILNRIGTDTSKLTADVVVADSTLKDYVGVYVLDPNMTLDISFNGGQLYIHPTGQNKSPIYPSTKTRFYSKVVNAQLTFNKDENGKVASLTLHQNGDHLAVRDE